MCVCVIFYSKYYLQTVPEMSNLCVFPARSLKSSGIGRLLVTVTEAQELKACKPNGKNTQPVAVCLTSNLSHANMSHHLCPGKSNPYCELTMGAQCYTSKSISDTLNPKWNFNCQFFIKDLYQDVLCITVFEKDQFSPDGESADTTKRCSHKQKGLLASCPVRIKGLNGCVPESDSGFHLH